MVTPRHPGRHTLLFALLAAAAAIAFATVVGTTGMAGSAGPPGNRDADSTATVASRTAALEFLPEDMYVVRRETLARTLPITGTLSALTTATVKAKVAGELVEVTVREGQRVRQGQLLARIDPTEAQARVAGRTADMEAARAQWMLAQKNRDNQRALVEKNFISQNAFDTTQSSYDVAVARLRAAEAELVSARKTLRDAALVAPFSGIVSERHAQPGERVALDAKVVSIVDLSRLTLEASVPATTIARVKVGQPVAFRVDGFGERSFAGRIERINPATAAGSRSISIYALIDNDDGQLRGGLFAQGELILERLENALVIPGSAVREDIGRKFVYAIDNGRLHRRPVKIGVSDGNGTVQVLEGLASGDHIVKNNLGQMRDGAAARVRDRPPSHPVRPAGN